jgi:YD repeat-containing protein
LNFIAAPNINIAYGYDRLGNRVALTDTTGTTRFVYDALYHLKTMTNPDNRTPVEVHFAGWL